MGYQHFKNVIFAGVAACVPRNVEENRKLSLLGDAEQIQKFIDTTGVETRHTVRGTDLCTSDMCYQAASVLLDELKWKREEVDCLLFVSQTPDYIMPATACILQARLGLKNECFAMDISLGCSGWIHGMATLGALMQNGGFKKGLLLAGDTSTVTKSPQDKSTYPLFGDGGTATALEYSEGAIGLRVHTATDGKGYKAILIPDGGFRNFFTRDSLSVHEYEEGVLRNNLQTALDGPAVFVFAISKAPKSILGLLEHFKIEMDKIDYFVLHQANKILNESIRMKLKLPVWKVPYSIEEFGNTSSSSIPLTMVVRLREQLKTGKCSLLTCGFGVGLSWGTICFDTENIVCPELILA